MPSPRTTPVKQRTRVSNACRRCRKHKVKCSGIFPCKNCSNRGVPCGIALEARQSLARASAIQDAETQFSDHGTPRQSQLNVTLTGGNLANTARSEIEASAPQNNSIISSVADVSEQVLVAEDADPSSTEDVLTVDSVSSHLKIPNPMVPEQPAYMKDEFGNLRYLGHSSTISLGRQLLWMIDQHPHFGNPTPPTPKLDADVYNVNACANSLTPADFTGLPSREVALFYVQALKFKTNPLFYLFDEASFLVQLQRFYENLTPTLYTDRTWYVHYLLVMAFGKTLTTPVDYGNVAGMDLFHRALRLLPDGTILWRDPFTAIEIMCCIALFLFSLDHRCAGYPYLGQAMRMAQVQGIHTDIQEDCVGHEFFTRGRQIWWTVYTLDRRLSASMGLPTTIRDKDITAPFPSTTSAIIDSAGQALHVSICQLLGKIIRTVYSAEGTLHKTFLAISQEVLRGIGSLAGELLSFSNRCLGEVSRVTAHLNLAYHQCIILCTRPYLLHLVKVKLESPTPTAPLSLSTTCKGIVQACVDSAVQITMTLSQLRQHQLLDTFLPFDLECCFSAGLVLAMTNGIHPKLVPRENWLSDILLVFDYMIGKGNAIASIRKSDVQELARVQWNSRPRQHRFSNVSHVSVGSTHISPSSSGLPSLDDTFFDQWGTNDGLTGEQLIDLANALDFSTDINLFSF